jgi:hypothetical protein
VQLLQWIVSLLDSVKNFIRFMKYLLLLLLTTGNVVVFSQNTADKPIRIQPNGVQVFGAKGNENPIEPQEKKIVIEKSINDWSLVECQEALYFIDLKIEGLKESGVDLNQISVYEQQKMLINERKQILISNK